MWERYLNVSYEYGRVPSALNMDPDKYGDPNMSKRSALGSQETLGATAVL